MSAVAGGSRPKVVIVGGGFGGLFAAKFLRRTPVDVTLVDRNNHHLFQPLLYQVATGILSSGQVAPPLREVLKRHRNVDVQLGEVAGFGLAARTIEVVRPTSTIQLPYDYLIVGTGVSGSYFGNDGFAEWAPGMKTLDDAIGLRAKIFGAFEMAELADDPDERASWLTFAVIGGGPTGVEVAGQIAELAHRSLTHNFRRFDPRDAKVLLFEGGDEILATFGDRLSGKATRELQRTGVEIRTNSRVTNMTQHDITVSCAGGDEKLSCRTKVWAAGVSAPPLAGKLADAAGAEVDRAGRIKVLPDCTLPNHPEVFVVGDVMALDELPGVAEVAMQSGIHAAEAIKRRTRGDEEARPFKYRDLGSMASVARFRAIVDFKGIRVAGLVGWLMWAVVHLTFLTGFKNRFFTAFEWAWTFIGRARDERAVGWSAAKWAVGDPPDS